MRRLLSAAAGAALLLALPVHAAPAGDIRLDRLIAAAEAVPMTSRPAESEAAWARALEAAQVSLQPGDPQLAMVMTHHVEALTAADQLARANEEIDRALALLNAAPSSPRPLLARAWYVKGSLLLTAGKNDEADVLLKRALDLQLQISPQRSTAEADIRFQIGVLRQQQGRIPEGAEAYGKAFEIRTALLKPGDGDLILSKMAYGNTLEQAGRLQEAEILERGAMDDALRYLPPDDSNTLLAIQTLASLLRSQGRADEAAAVQQRAIDIAKASHPGSDLYGQALGLMGIIRIDQGKSAEAEAAFLAANEVLIKIHGHDSRVVALTFSNAAASARNQGKHKEAVERYEEALAILKRMGDVDPFLAAQARVQYASSLEAVGRGADAMEQARMSAEWMDANLPADDPRRVTADVGSAWFQLRNGKSASGSQALAGLADPVMADAASRTLAPSQVQQRRLKVNIDRVMVGLYEANEMERGFRLAQLSIETDAGRAAAALSARLRVGSDTLADVLRKRQALSTDREKINSAYAEAIAKAPDQAPALAARLRQADADLAALDLRLEREFPNHRIMVTPQTVTLTEAQARLRPDEALIVPVLAGNDLITIALTRKTAVWDRTPGEQADARALIGRVRSGLGQRGAARAAVDASGDAVSGPRAFDRQAAFQLYQAIFTPKIRAATKGVREISVATGPALSTLPFSVLVTRRPEGDDHDPKALRNTAWLVRTAAIQAAPAIRAMRQEAPRPEAGGGFFGAGAPALDGKAQVLGAAAYFRDGQADLTSLKSLPPLPAAEGELKAMAVSLGQAGAQVLTGAAATERAVKAADLSHARVIAFATHGLVGGDLTGLSEPGLVFTPPAASSPEDDGVLTASEAANLKLDADWVVLSACNTASGDRPEAPGYTGLARAFIFAGGKRVLASHWPVRDDAAARLTVDTVRAAARGDSPAQALRKAELRLIDDPRMSDGSDPSVWAPFELIGR
jgi:CHAT domain-containing protein/Tfp pilus assembly protein PilF